MKILICVASFGSSQIPFLRQLVAEFKQWKNHAVDIVVDSTEPVELVGVEVRLHPARVGQALTFTHRQLMFERRTEYDYYLYTENDILITESAFEALLSEASVLPEGYITGFLRYEIKSGNKYLIDAHPTWPVLSLVCNVKGHRYFCLENLHSGCFVLTSQQLSRAIDSGGFHVRPHLRPYGLLEQGASDVYTQCGFRQKVIPLNFAKLCVHHLPDKYVTLGGVWDNPGPHTVKSLLELLDAQHEEAWAGLPPFMNKVSFVSRVLRKLRTVLRLARS